MFVCSGPASAQTKGTDSQPTRKPSVTLPELLGSTDVPYPKDGKGDAAVVLELVVSQEGRVTASTVVDGSEPFSSQAQNAAFAWRFKPATRDGKATTARIRFKLTFKEPKPEPEPEPEPKEPKKAGSGAPSRTAPATATKREEPQGAVILGERPPPGRVSMSRADVRQLPGAFGDPFRAIEVLPGVTPIATGVPFFFVRGAPPGNVGYYLDGIRVPLLYHVGLGPSVVNPGLIKSVDLYPGGYPAAFGRYAGGIVSGETNEARSDFHGEGQVRLLDTGGYAEGGFADGRGTVLLGGRYSYTALLLSLISPEIELQYWDYQARITYALDNKNTVGVFSFGSFDLLAEEQPDGSTETIVNTQFHRVDLRWNHQASNKTSIDTAVMLGVDRTDAGEGEFAIIDELGGVRGRVLHQATPTVQYRAGYDLLFENYSLQRDDDEGDIADLFPGRRDFTAGVWLDAVIDVTRNVTITPGLRTDLYNQGPDYAVGIDPRIAALYRISPEFRIVHTLGIAHQPPSFPVPIPGFSPSGIDQGLQRTAQASAGVELDLPSDFELKATIFQSAFFDMTDVIGTADLGDENEETTGGTPAPNPNPNPDPAPQPDPGVPQDPDDGDDDIRELQERTLGRTVGLELSIGRPLSKRLGGFLSYTLSRSTRTAKQGRFPSNFDRTHVLNLAAAYDLGKRWRAGARVAFYTGRPSARRNPDGSRPRSPDRLPPFFRADVRLEKRWKLGDRGYWAFVIEVLNATLSKEVISDECNNNQCAEQEIGPVTIPSIGLEAFF